MKFTELDLHPDLLQGIQDKKFEDLTPVQEQTIPIALQCKDISVLSQTGTGKTAAYAIPLIERTLRAQTDPTHERAWKDYRPSQYVLVLVPTRELAEQVVENIRSLSTHTKVRAVAVYGGTGYDVQKKAFAEGVEFVVATPGRLIELYKEQIFDLHQACAVVFDEADRMFDMGFKDDMKYLLHRIPRTRQFLVLSATMNFDVLNTAYQFGSEPIEISIGRDQATAENISHEIFHVGGQDKPAYLLSLIRKYKPRQTIVFSNFKNNVERIAQFLASNEVSSMGISSLLSQQQRSRIMEGFKDKNEIAVLVATDVAARGLDIQGVDLVINFELPDDPENYVHRIGRTGRAGASGHAFSLVSDRDVDALARIENYLKNKVATGWLEDTDIVRELNPMKENTWRDDMRKHSDQRRDRQQRRPQGGGRGGPRPDHRGGPRREGGPRDQRGPRPDHRRGPRPEGGRPDHRNEHRNENRAEGQGGEHRHDNRGENRHDNRRPHGDRPRHQQGQNRNQNSNQNHRKHGQHPQHRQGPRPPQQGDKRGHQLVRQGGQNKGQQGAYKGGRYRVQPEGAAKKSLGKTISSFFKNLFGDE